MADNITILDGSGNPVVIRSKVISGIQTQVLQFDIGGESAEVLVDSGNPMPTYFPSSLFGTGNPGSVAPQTGYLESTASGAASGSTTLIASTDCIAYRTISIHVTANDSTDEVIWQGSNDHSTWLGFGLVKSTDTSATLVLNGGSSSIGEWHGTLPFRYFKLIRNATASNIAVVVELRQ